MNKETLMLWVEHQFTQNDIFTGIIGGSIFAAGLYSLRSLPSKVWRAYKFNFTTEMTVHNDDEAFDWLNEWLAAHQYARRARRLKLSTFDVYSELDENNKHWTLSPGHGDHWFFHKGNLLLVSRAFGDDNTGTLKPRETITIRLFRRSPKYLRELVNEAGKLREGAALVKVYGYDDYWRCVARKLPREIDSVVLPDIQIKRIINDTTWFVRSALWYKERGVPYRRGYLLSGPPGCGKTSLVVALASYLERPIYTLNLGGISHDNQLFSALGSIPTNAVLLIEDIDAAIATKKRNGKVKATKGMTLSGLLNALDGVTSNDGRLLIMTTNHPEKLDPALIRPGRVDVHEKIDFSGPIEAGKLFLRFFPGEKDLAKVITETTGLRATGAELQGVFMEYNDNAQAAQKNILKPEKMEE